MHRLQTYGRHARFLTLLATFLLLFYKVSSQTELPDSPDLIRVTVDHDTVAADGTMGVLIQWEPSEDDSIKFYHLYKMNAGQSFERIFTFSATTFEYTHMSSGLKNLTYSVTAEDSTGNESLFGQNIHQAVAVSLEFDPCTPSNLITWTPYVGWGGKVSGYEIYGGVEGEPMESLGFDASGDFSFEDTTVTPGFSYSYYVEAINIDKDTSRSAITSINSFYPIPPDFIRIDYVSVVEPNSVELQFTADVSGPVKNFRIMKRNNTGAPFTELSTLWNVSQTSNTLLDQFPTSTTTYTYIVQSVFQPEGCPVPLVLSESNTGKSILLTSSLDQQTVSLNWSPYETCDAGLSEYVVQRRSGNEDFSDIQSLGPGSSQWQEAIQNLIPESLEGYLEYRVLAVCNSSGQSEAGISISNVTSVTVETHVEVPSAFTPNSNDINSEFKPRLDFAPKEYLMIIMDRGGRKMFETTDSDQAWDGRFQNGEFVNEGVYVYYIQLTDFTGLFKTFTGNVTVLYP